MEGKIIYLKSLRALHLGLLLGQFIFLAVAVFLLGNKVSQPVSQSLDKTLQVLALLVSFGSVFTGSSFFKKRLLTINTTATGVTEKLDQYRSANIVRWAMLEGACLFTIVCFFITGNYSFAALALALMVFFALLIPSKLKTMLQLQLSQQEADML